MVLVMDMDNFTFLLILDTKYSVISIITVVYKRTWKLSALTLTVGGLSEQYSAHRTEHMLVTLQVPVVGIGNYIYYARLCQRLTYCLKFLYLNQPSWRHLPHLDNQSMIAYRESDIHFSWNHGEGRGDTDTWPRTCGYVKEGEDKCEFEFPFFLGLYNNVVSVAN
jgi:hypothetical protein